MHLGKNREKGMTENNIEDLSAWLVGQLVKRNWSQRELARRAEISPTTISEVIAGQRAPTYEFCAQIASPLGIHPVEIFVIAGLIPDPDIWNKTEMSFRQLYEIAKQLTYEERLELIRYARWRAHDRGDNA